MTTTRISGPRHPLLQRIGKADAIARRTWLATAQAIAADHASRGISDQTIYEITQPGSWRHIGSYEDHQAALTMSPRYVAVDSRDFPGLLARRIAEALTPSALPGTRRRACQLRDAADAAAPMVAVALAVCVRLGLVEWDTDETVQDAARRVALDAGWDLLAQPNPALGQPGGGDLFAATLDRLGIVDRPAVDYAREYLGSRVAIDAALTERGIEWGGEHLSALRSAARAGVVGPTWRAYVARGEAPAADTDRQWRAATVDAWRLARPRISVTGW